MRKADGMGRRIERVGRGGIEVDVEMQSGGEGEVRAGGRGIQRDRGGNARYKRMRDSNREKNKRQERKRKMAREGA